MILSIHKQLKNSVTLKGNTQMKVPHSLEYSDDLFVAVYLKENLRSVNTTNIHTEDYWADFEQIEELQEPLKVSKIQ